MVIVVGKVEAFTYKGTVSSRVGNQGLLVESESNGLRMTRGGFLPSGPAECYAIVS